MADLNHEAVAQWLHDQGFHRQAWVVEAAPPPPAPAEPKAEVKKPARKAAKKA